MAEKTLKINSIFGGHAATQYFGAEGTFNTSIALDPDLPIISTDIRTSGFAVPVGYAVFSGANVNAPVLRLITNPKNTLTYAVLTNGRLISYTSSFASETLIASTFTVTIASPAVFTLTAHGLSATSSSDSTLGNIVYFSTTGALPTGLTAGTAYYVISAGLTANAFQVSTTAGGTAVNTSGTQSGTHSITVATSWAEYYNNYIYLFTGTNVSRYGPLNNSPTLTHGFWVTTLGLTVLSNTTYPSLRSVTMPNHVAHVHGDNSLYFCDFGTAGTTIAGQGSIHRINTKKVTDEGDTNGTVVPSAYNVLDLPFGFYPTAIKSYGTDLMILGIYTTNTVINQGKAAFVIWDPTDTTSFKLGPVFLSDPLATALLNVGGVMHVWTGNSVNGVRLSRYLGGEIVKDIVYQEEGMPPLAGAVDALGNRIVWGGFSTNPAAGGVVYAFGSKDARLPQGLHNIVKTTAATTTPIVTALKYIQQNSNITPKLVPAWTDTSAANFGMDQYSTTATLGSFIRFMFVIGQKFNITKISIPLAGSVNSTTTITPKVWFDDLSSSSSPTVINNTNYASKRKIIYKGTELKDYIGQNNFTLEFAWSSTNPLPIAFPITIELDIKESEAV